MTWPRAKATLVCMRLADMTFMHPRQDDSRSCAQCGERVAIYPSGQKVLKANPATRIVCARCAVAKMFAADTKHMRCGPLEEIRQEGRESVRKSVQ